MFLSNLWYAIKWVLAVGFVLCIVGQMFPRSRFRYDRFPYKAFNWEQEGKFYNKFHISKWKTHLPDMSKIIKNMYSKQLPGKPTADGINRLIQETCVAENVHWILVFMSPYLYSRIGGMTGFVFMILNMMGNLPFIMIQRFNRPRLIKVHDKLLSRQTGEEAEPKCEENDDSPVALNV